MRKGSQFLFVHNFKGMAASLEQTWTAKILALFQQMPTMIAMKSVKLTLIAQHFLTLNLAQCKYQILVIERKTTQESYHQFTKIFTVSSLTAYQVNLQV